MPNRNGFHDSLVAQGHDAGVLVPDFTAEDFQSLARDNALVLKHGADRLEPTMTAEQHSSSVGSADRPACPTSLATSIRLTQCRDSLLTSAALPRPWAQADSSGL